MKRDDLLFKCRAIADDIGLQHTLRTRFFAWLFPGRVFHKNQCQAIAKTKRSQKDRPEAPTEKESAEVVKFLKNYTKWNVPSLLIKLKQEIQQSLSKTITLLTNLTLL